MNTVLDDAEQRITTAADSARTTRAEIVDGMRQEIGGATYETAKVKLLELEQAIAKTYRPFLDRITAIAARSNSPLPQQVQVWLQEMGMLSESVPRTIRDGITEWDKLAPPIGKDGKSVDPNERARLIHHVRFCLRNWDGTQERLEHLRGQTEHYIRESNWPASPPRVAA